MAHNVSDKKLRKGAAAGKQMPVHDSVIPLNAADFEHPNRIKTPFTEEQKARVEKLVPIFMELQPDIVKGFPSLQNDIWPEKELLMYEVKVQSYEAVLQKRKLKVDRRTRHQRLNIIDQCYSYFTKDWGPEIPFDKEVYECCTAVYEARKAQLDEAIEKSRALTALCDLSSYCGFANVKLLVCSRCKAARYCNKECQKDDWKKGKHKGLCNMVVSGEVTTEEVPRMRFVETTPVDARKALIPIFSYTAKPVRNGKIMPDYFWAD